jgi:hypothetical protein
MPLRALFRLAFASPSRVSRLSSPHAFTRRLILLKARRQGCPLRPVVSIQFQSLFHSPRRGSFHLSLTVLFRYRSSCVFSLGEWTPLLPTMLACIVVLRILPCCFATPTGLSPLSLTFPDHSASLYSHFCSPITPACKQTGLGFSAFARHY